MVNCDEGRKIGCKTFCCRLLVRLTDEEVRKLYGEPSLKRFVDKDIDGYCTHFDRESQRCNIWENRPQVCREYECNSDFLLQIAVRHEFTNIAELVLASRSAYIPKETFKYVPLINKDKD